MFFCKPLVEAARAKLKKEITSRDDLEEAPGAAYKRGNSQTPQEMHDTEVSQLTYKDRRTLADRVARYYKTKLNQFDEKVLRNRVNKDDQTVQTRLEQAVLQRGLGDYHISRFMIFYYFIIQYFKVRSYIC